ncbi:DUF2142 domain-containing protein [Collinsella sp. LCP19S3_C1]|uniref:DUF2142 domain-containing protein n=1 Tax=Collinsella sp. LCP19S3_C1 TaxID=3438758 RepID=UPI003F90DEF2
MSVDLNLNNSHAFRQMVLYILASLALVVSEFALTLRFAAGLASSTAFVCLFVLLAAILLGLFIVMFRRVGKRREAVFALVAIPAVTAFALFLLPAHAPDEAAHIAQTVNLFARGTSGHLVPKAFSLTSADYPGTYAAAYAAVHSPSAWDDVYLCTRNLSSYLPHLYLVPYIVMGLGQLLSAPEYVTLLAARVVNGLMFAGIGYWVVRTLPFGKTPAIVYLLNPILLQQASSLSADSLVIGINLAFLAYFLRCLKSGCENRQQVFLLGGLTLLSMLSKFAYAPLVLLFILFLRHRVSGKRLYVLYTGIAGACMVAAVFLITFYHGSFMPEAFELLRTPFEFVKIFVKSVWVMGTFWFESYAGFNLGALNINPWRIACYLYMFVQVAVLFYNDDAEEPFLVFSDKLVIVTISLVEFTLIMLTMRGWTLTADNRSDIIMGVQGRYYLPFALLPMLCLVKPAHPLSKGRVLSVASACMVVVLGIDIMCVIMAFLPYSVA